MGRRRVSSSNGLFMSRKSAKRNIILFLIALGVGAGVGIYKLRSDLRPEPKGAARLIRYDRKQPLSTTLYDLEQKKIIRSATALGLYARMQKMGGVVEAGTYSLAPGMEADAVLHALRNPVTVRVTVPEYFWISRTAELMEKRNIAPAQEFAVLAAQPADFQAVVDFPLPADTLEGYLFPDTYKMQPLVGAKSAITQQLHAFGDKVWKGLMHGKPVTRAELKRIVTIASMVEREAKFDEDRPLIASVIENRLAKGMPLEVDATVLYAQQRWHVPRRSDIRNTISPYNTYKHRGLPPGPICSPGLKSIEAAMHPAKTPYLYYVAMPDGQSLFAATHEGHLANVAKRRRAMRSEAR